MVAAPCEYKCAQPHCVCNCCGDVLTFNSCRGPFSASSPTRHHSLFALTPETRTLLFVSIALGQMHLIETDEAIGHTTLRPVAAVSHITHFTV